MLCSDISRHGKSGVVHNWPEYSKSLAERINNYSLVKDPANVTWTELGDFCENFLKYYNGPIRDKSFLVSVDAGIIARHDVHQRIKSSYQLVSGYIQFKDPLNNNEIINKKNKDLIKSLLLDNFQEIINEYGENPNKEKIENNKNDMANRQYTGRETTENQIPHTVPKPPSRKRKFRGNPLSKTFKKINF
jgi:hypothetical protein